MQSNLDPRRILVREEERARRELARSRRSLAQRLRVVDLRALVWRHPVLTLVGGAAAGFLGAFPLLPVLRGARSLARPAARGLGILLWAAARRALLVLDGQR